MNEVTPMMAQWHACKAQAKDALLFFRLGDFYETFDEDAEITARELDIVLTSRPIGNGVRAPLAGIPFATAIALRLGARRVGFTEKVGGDKELICRFDLSPGENFLMIEEMTTTGATPRRGIEAVLKRNPEAIPLDVVGAFLVRCHHCPPELQGRELVSLVSLPDLDVHYNEWDPLDCPLCKKGSKPVEDCKWVWLALLRTMTDPTYPLEPAC